MKDYPVWLLATMKCNKYQTGNIYYVTVQLKCEKKLFIWRGAVGVKEVVHARTKRQGVVK